MRMARDGRRARVAVGAACAIALACGGVEATPPSANQALLAGILDRDVRIIAMGDSFATPRFDRVFAVSLLVWPYSEITALGGGCAPNGPLECVIAAHPSERINALHSYEVLRSTPETAYFALPLRNMEEVYLDSRATLGGEQGVMYALRLNNTALSAGEHGRITNAGDEMRFRPLYWSPPALELLLADATLLDGNQAQAVVDLRHEARQRWSEGGDPSGGVGVDAKTSQINATAIDIDMVKLMDADPTARVAEGKTPAIGSDTYFDYAGGVLVRTNPATGERLPGTYCTYLADDSWSYSGFGSDEAAGGPLEKVFSLEQLTTWLDVTTIDRDQRVVVFYYLAVEAGDPESIKGAFEAMIDQTQAAADLVGITEVSHVLVIPHMHDLGGLSLDETIAHFSAVRDMAYELASERVNVAAMSIFDATDHIFFNGSAPAKAWLTEHGYNEFTYGSYVVDLVNGPLGGDLLDGPDLHPASMDAAAFFSSFLGDILVCAGVDCNGDEQLDVLDFICFQDAWAGKTAFGDCDADGAFDVLDFICFQSRFLKGCP